jgi:hypothetical protein
MLRTAKEAVSAGITRSEIQRVSLSSGGSEEEILEHMQERPQLLEFQVDKFGDYRAVKTSTLKRKESGHQVHPQDHKMGSYFYGGGPLETEFMVRRNKLI